MRIRIISEVSRDTEDWCEDAENSAAITNIHLNILIENSYFKL